jgi:acetyl esterase/lipase
MADAAGWALLVFGGFGALCGVAGLVRRGRQDALAIWWFAFGLVGSEFVAPMIPLGLAGTALLASLGALDTWPGRLGGALSLLALAAMAASLRRAWRDGAPLEQALQQALGADYQARILPQRAATLRQRIAFGEWARPFHYRRPGVATVRDIVYGEHGIFNHLDVVRPDGPVVPGRPVLLHIHGGAWMIGEKHREALPLIRHLAQRGWVVATINYRLSPAARWPAHAVDAKRALAWVRAHIAEHGGDPEFVAVTGGSAGGHLTSLLALTPNRPEFQPGFEAVDTTVQAAVPYYGKYDFIDREGLVGGSHGFTQFLVDKVMPCPPPQDPALWDGASPSQQVHADAPPFFVLQGTHDTLIFVQEARAFVRRLRAVARRPVAYAEQHGAQHAFDLVHSIRTEFTVDAVHRFLEICYSDHLRRRGARAAAVGDTSGPGAGQGFGHPRLIPPGLSPNGG